MLPPGLDIALTSETSGAITLRLHATPDLVRRFSAFPRTSHMVNDTLVNLRVNPNLQSLTPDHEYIHMTDGKARRIASIYHVAYIAEDSAAARTLPLATRRVTSSELKPGTMIPHTLLSIDYVRHAVDLGEVSVMLDIHEDYATVALSRPFNLATATWRAISSQAAHLCSMAAPYGCTLDGAMAHLKSGPVMLPLPQLVEVAMFNIPSVEMKPRVFLSWDKYKAVANSVPAGVHDAKTKYLGLIAPFVAFEIEK